MNDEAQHLSQGGRIVLIVAAWLVSAGVLWLLRSQREGISVIALTLFLIFAAIAYHFLHL
jgi:hypothetical protein